MFSNIREFPRAAAPPLVPTSPPGSIPHDALDAALIERIAGGDTSAMRVLYTRHSSRIYRFILRLTHNRATAEELVNEVFLHVWRSASKFEGRSQLSTWLLAVARHKALGLLRRASTESLDEDAYKSIEDMADNPEAAMQKKQKGAILRSCLTKLSPAHREIIDLVYFHGKTINDAAVIIGITQNTVKTRMFYARKRLAELLGAQGVVTASA
jgi:RNA polymerase sigma-70 factor (ECF subfamily)